MEVCQGEQMAAEFPADELWNQSELDDLDVIAGMDLQLHQPDGFYTDVSDPGSHAGPGQKIRPLLFRSVQARPMRRCGDPVVG